jgi:hypothetical protein
MHGTSTQTAVPMAVRKLLASGQGGRLEADVAPWNLHQGKTVTPGGERQSDDNYSDDDSVDSEGSSITVIVDSTEKRIPLNKARTSASPDDSVPEEQTLSPTNRVTPGTPCFFLCHHLKNYRKHRQKN